MTSSSGLAKLIQRQIRDVKSKKLLYMRASKCYTQSISTRLVLQKEMTQTAPSSIFSIFTAQTPLTGYSYTILFQQNPTLTIVSFPQNFAAIPPLPIAFPLSLSLTTFAPSLPSTLKLSALIFPSICAAPPTTVRLGSISALISHGLPSLDVLPTFSYPNGLLNASEIFLECARILSPQLWLPRLPSGDGLASSLDTGTAGAGRGVTNCSYVGSGRSANCVEGADARGCRFCHILAASARAFSRISACWVGERPGMEMSSRRKFVGPDCEEEKGR
jgi:hypothetical protein